MNFLKKKINIAVVAALGAMGVVACGGGGGGGSGGSSSNGTFPQSVESMNAQQYASLQKSMQLNTYTDSFGNPGEISEEALLENKTNCKYGRDCIVATSSNASLTKVTEESDADEGDSTDEPEEPVVANKCVGVLCFGEQYKNETKATFEFCNSGANCIENVCLSNDCQDTTGDIDRSEQDKVLASQLGAIYTKNKTTFRIWSPNSQNVKVEIQGIGEFELLPAIVEGYDKEGVYECEVLGDLDGRVYQFYIDGKPVRDPYARMTVPNATGKDGSIKYTASVIIDLKGTEPSEGWAKTPTLTNREDAIIYEVHVRDFTIDESSGVDKDNRGRYLGMVQPNTKVNGEANGLATGIEHLKKLGVTHVQLLPVYDYATCQEVGSQDGTCYNWGYDPVNYNIPEDRYSQYHNTQRYKDKVREFKQMVNEFHKAGIRVIMDVVYNHTYLGNVLPSFYYDANRYDLSGCGNSLEGSNPDGMISKMIRDSLEYWVSEYNIDGFRFDLIGVFHSDVFFSWGKYLNNKYSDRTLLMYGEPWQGGGDQNLQDHVRTGTVYWQTEKYAVEDYSKAYVGVFNNRVRNCLRGGNDNEAIENGFIFNGKNTNGDGNGTDNDGITVLAENTQCVPQSFKGGVRQEGAQGTDIWTAAFATAPYMSINYLTCHDNLSFVDRILDTQKDLNRLNAYGHATILLSQGIPFMHGGEEIGRTRQDVKGQEAYHNAYNSAGFVKGKHVNDFIWSDMDKSKAVYEYLAEVIKLRKDHPAFRLTTRDDIVQKVKTLKTDNNSFIVMQIDASDVPGEAWSDIIVAFNSSEDDKTYDVPDGYTRAMSGMNVKNAKSNIAEHQSVTVWFK